jgi:hypothetical protein
MFFFMARKPQNPVNDISKLVGGWLGGSGPGTNPTVVRVQSQVKQAAKAADAALGGFGQAAVNDARRLSSGAGYVPSETIKAAAVNTAAAAAGQLLRFRVPTRQLKKPLSRRVLFFTTAVQ